MGRTSFSGPVKSAGGFEVGTGGSESTATNTTIIDGSGTITVPAGQTLAAAVPTSSVTGNVTLTAAQSGTVFLVGSDAATVTLPATAAGVMYTFLMSANTNAVNISPNASDKIQGKAVLGTSTTTLSMSGTDNKDLKMTTTNAAVGDNVVIVGDGGDGWILLSGRGLGLAEET